jgi:hypothetical protein
VYNFTYLPPRRIKKTFEEKGSKYLQKIFYILSPLPLHPMHTLIDNDIVCGSREDSTGSCPLSVMLHVPLRETLPVNGSDPEPIDRRYCKDG